MVGLSSWLKKHELHPFYEWWKTGFLEPGVVIVPPRDVPVNPLSYCERAKRASANFCPPLVPTQNNSVPTQLLSSGDITAPQWDECSEKHVFLSQSHSASYKVTCLAIPVRLDKKKRGVPSSFFPCLWTQLFTFWQQEIEASAQKPRVSLQVSSQARKC